MTEQGKSKPRFAAIILTLNEERDLPECLESLRGLAEEIYLVDSGSTDKTIEIAREYGASVMMHAFENQAKQLNWALEQISTDAEWIIRIDADERITEKLKNSLHKAAETVGMEITGIEFPRRIVFLGHSIRYGDTYPVWILRAWRNGAGTCKDIWMDEYIELLYGQTVRVQGDLLHDIPKNITDWTAKHNSYATRECIDILGEGIELSEELSIVDRKKMKQSVYLRLPLFVRAFVYWFYRYFLKLGFLDGTAGLIYHFIQGFWYRFLIDAKIWEKRSAVRNSAQKTDSEKH